jgi:hypothetical protein
VCVCVCVCVCAHTCAHIWCINLNVVFWSHTDLDTIMTRFDTLPFTPVDPHQPVPDVMEYCSMVMAEEDDNDADDDRDAAANIHGDEMPNQLDTDSADAEASDLTRAPTVECTGATLPAPPRPSLPSLPSTTVSSTQSFAAEDTPADNGYGLRAYIRSVCHFVGGA